MPAITLELVTDSTTLTKRSVVLTIATHIHQRVERFKYLDDIKPIGVALDYIENPELDSWRHLQIANRTYSIPANADKNIESRKDFNLNVSTAIASQYKDIAITNRMGVDPNGKKRPLFFAHKLPDGTVSCEVEIVSRGNLQKIDTGYSLDISAGYLYTNYANYFDPDTGAYTLFYLTSTDSDGNSYRELLYPEPVAKEADWEDIDLDTGRLTKERPVYSKEKNSSGYTFYMNDGDSWYSRPINSSLIQPRLPFGRDPQDPWYIRFSAGDITTVINSASRRYYVPEYEQQRFAPFKPYIYSPYERMLWVNERVLAGTRQNLGIDPEKTLHLNIYISDYEGNLLRVLTTNSVLDGTRYSDTDVFYEADQIESWDNAGGFISLSTKLSPSYQIAAQYYYKSDDYEYIGYNLNPIYNKKVKDNMVVFYIVPDVDSDDHAIHHLVVNSNGVIIECSQGQGFAHANLQLLKPDGSYNPDTVIGKTYISDLGIETFTSLYVAGSANTNGYGILAEVVVLSLDDEDDMYVYDVRKVGGSIVEDSFEAVIAANPRILQSAVGYGEYGQDIPKNKVVLIEPPLSLLKDYGGSLEKERAEALLIQHMDSSVYPLIEWDYPAPEISATSLVAGQVELTWTWVGQNITHRLYRTDNLADEWVEINSQAIGATSPADLTYTDTSVSEGDVVYYTVRIEQQVNGQTVLYPRTHSIAVKVSKS